MQALDARDRLTHLRRLAIFQGLDDAELWRLARVGICEAVQRRDPIYSAGQRSDRVFVLLRGTAKVTRAARHRQVALAIVRSGSLIGEMALLSEGVRADTALALEPATVCGFTSSHFEAFLRRHPDLALGVARAIACRLEGMRERIDALLSQDVRTRLARTLAGFVPELGVPVRGGSRIDLRLTQTDLAELIGSTRETTSMAFNDLKRRGWVAADRGGIVVRDLRALLGS